MSKRIQAEEENPKKIFEVSYMPERGKFTAQELVEYKLNGSDYDRGQFEELRAGVENAREGLARLTQILFDKKVLTKLDVYRIAGETGMNEDPTEIEDLL